MTVKKNNRLINPEGSKPDSVKLLNDKHRAEQPVSKSDNNASNPDAKPPFMENLKKEADAYRNMCSEKMHGTTLDRKMKVDRSIPAGLAGFANLAE